MQIHNILTHLLLIAEGWLKWLYDMVTRSGSLQSLKRLSICTLCEMNKHGICSECGCIIKAKVRVEYPLDEDGKAMGGCPLEKW